MTQWVGDEVEVIGAYDTVCLAMAGSQVDRQGGHMKYLTGCNLTEYNYMSMNMEGFVPISVNPMISATRLTNYIV
jgi:hypothetical protein